MDQEFIELYAERHVWKDADPQWLPKWYVRFFFSRLLLELIAEHLVNRAVLAKTVPSLTDSRFDSDDDDDDGNVNMEDGEIKTGKHGM